MGLFWRIVRGKKYRFRIKIRIRNDMWKKKKMREERKKRENIVKINERKEKPAL